MSKPLNQGFLKLAKARKSTYEFSNKPVKKELIKQILEAGRWAPSCANVQPWHFIVVRNKKMISRIIKTAYYGDFHTDPAAIIACVLKSNQCLGEHRCVAGGLVGILEGNLCVSMAALQMLLMATDLGVDSCILTPDLRQISGLLRVPKADSVPLMIGIGYEKEEAHKKKRERKSLKEIVSFETYNG